jgi:hypothetical protein
MAIMLANLCQEDLGSASSPLRFTWPEQLLRGPSPLARRQERLSTTSQAAHSAASTQLPSKLPPFHEIFEAAAEPPPPYTELPRVPFSSFYALAYDRSLNSQHHVIPVQLLHNMEDVDIDAEDELRFLDQLTIDMTCDLMEVDTPSPTTTSFRRSSKLGPWRVPEQTLQRYLLRRQRDPVGQRALECLRTNFILEHVPHLANALRQFEDRAYTPGVDVFYDWYDVLSVDQRVRYMPWFIPERLDLVRATPPTAKAPSQNEKTATNTASPAPQTADVAAAKEAVSKRKESRCPTPPPSFASAQGWDELDQAVRLLRILPNRQQSKQLRKEALIRAWKSSIAKLGWTQW